MDQGPTWSQSSQLSLNQSVGSPQSLPTSAKSGQMLCFLVYNPLSGCEKFPFPPGKREGQRREAGRYSAPLGEKELRFIKLPLDYLHASAAC